MSQYYIKAAKQAIDMANKAALANRVSRGSIASAAGVSRSSLARHIKKQNITLREFLALTKESGADPAEIISAATGGEPIGGADHVG